MSQVISTQNFPISGSSLYLFYNQRLTEIKNIQQTHSKIAGSGIDFDTAIVIWLTTNLIDCRKSGIF